LKKFSFLAFVALNSAAVAEFNIGALAGINFFNGNFESKRERDSARYYKTSYNLKSFSMGVCAGYDYFFNSLMLGIDTSWLKNSKKWHEIGQTSNGAAGVLTRNETIYIKSLPQYGAGVRIGYLCGRFLPYLRLGFEKIKFKARLVSASPIAFPPLSSSYYLSKTKTVASSGLGFEYKMYDNFWIRAEGRYINSKSYRMKYWSNAYASDARLRISSRRILLTTGIIYRF
jgi:opacity protein-like surface antigen